MRSYARALFLFLGTRAFVAGNSVIFQKGTQTYIRPRSLAAIKESGRGLPRVRIAFFIIGKRLTAHRSAGEEARALSFISAARRLARRRVYDEAGNMIETHEHAGDFKEW